MSYGTGWFAEKILAHDKVVGASSMPNGLVEVSRKELPSLRVAPVAVDRISRSLVERLLDNGGPDVVVSLLRESHYDWVARVYAQDRGSTIHTYREFVTFLGEPDPRPCLDKRVSYITEKLRQHRSISSVDMICEASFSVARAGLRPLVIAVAYEYEMTEEALVSAIQRHPEASIIYNANPNGRTTTAAVRHAADSDTETLRFRELMPRMRIE